MSNKRIKEARNLSKEELVSRIRDTKRKLFDLRMQKKTGQLENTSSMWLTRKTLARMNMVLADMDRKQ